MSKQFYHSVGDLPKAGIAIPLNNLSLSVVDGAPGYGKLAVTGLPVGNILYLGMVAYLQFTTTSANVTSTFTGTVSIGTVGTTDNDVADAGEADLCPSTTLTAATAKVSPVLRLASTDALGGGFIDNTDGDKGININLLIDDASISGAATFTVSGVIHLAAFVLGDD